MYIDVAVPAVLPLAFAKLDVDGVEKTVLLGVTLQHPPTHASVTKSAALNVYGPRAHVMHKLATQYAEATDCADSAEIKIENTTPSMVGFGADGMMALLAAQALAWTNGRDHEDIAALAQQIQLDDPLALHAYQKAGVLLVELDSAENEQPKLLRHAEIKHKDNKAWAFVFHYPRVPEGLSDTIEQDRLPVVREAAALLTTDSGQLLNDTWAALEADDLGAFAAGLVALREQNLEALEKTGQYPSANEHAQKVYGVYQENEAVAWGESYFGIGIFCLIEGALRSQETRKDLVKALGFGAGQHDATITDVRGAHVMIKDVDMHLHDYPLPNLVDGVSGIGRNRP